MIKQLNEQKKGRKEKRGRVVALSGEESSVGWQETIT